MSIVRYDGINNRGISLLIAEGLYEMSLLFPTEVINVHYQDKALVYYSISPGEPIAFITYVVFKDQNFIFINLGYVIKAYRRHGIYLELLDELMKVAREEKISKITSNISSENHYMINYRKKYGSKLIAHTFETSVI